MIHSKLYWREYVKETKRDLTQEQLKDKSGKICSKLMQHPKFLNAKCILSYWPLPREASLIALNNLALENKILLLPVIENNEIILKQYTGSQNMMFGQFGINEPLGEKWTDISTIDLILVPGIAFDSNNNRLGRGKGYYDRFLQSTIAYKIGICFDFQLIDHIPVEPHDLSVNEVITD